MVLLSFEEQLGSDERAYSSVYSRMKAGSWFQKGTSVIDLVRIQCCCTA